MNDFVYQNVTKVYFGRDQLKNLSNEIKLYGNKVLITYGGGTIKKIGLFDKVVNVLNESGIEWMEFGGIEPNPRIETVNAAVALCKKEKIEVLLPIGGGSTIDASKAIAAGYYYDGDVWDLWSRVVRFSKALPIIDILTLSATGSETNMGGVISKMDTNEKIGLLNPALLPKAAFLNPENTFSVNPFQTAAGAADMMSHMIEQYFTIEHMDMMDEITEGIMRTVIKHAPIAMIEPDNYESRSNLMWSGTWALNGFLQMGKHTAWSCHDIEHELSAFYDITHGLGLAILTPRWMNYVLNEKNVFRFKRFAIKVFNVEDTGDDFEIAKEGINRLSQFFINDLKLSPSLSAININDEYFKKMAHKASKGKEIKGLVSLNADDIEKILINCL